MVSFCQNNRKIEFQSQCCILFFIRKVQRNNNNNNNGVNWAQWVGGKARFQQSATTHSGTGEKETLNINNVGMERKTVVYKNSPGQRPMAC